MADEQAIRHSCNFKDITGQRFGKLTVLAYAGKTTGSQTLWKCRCDCGNEVTRKKSAIGYGNTTTCGCGKSQVKHGLSRSLTYSSWKSMVARCYDPRCNDFNIYGGSGVQVCEQWRHSPEKFLKDVGERPSKSHSLDRYPNKFGNYEPGNVRWATGKEQHRNRSNNLILTVNGVSACVAEWAEKTGIGISTIWVRKRKLGWSDEDAVTRPVRRKVVME